MFVCFCPDRVDLGGPVLSNTEKADWGLWTLFPGIWDVEEKVQLIPAEAFPEGVEFEPSFEMHLDLDGWGRRRAHLIKGYMQNM